MCSNLFFKIREYRFLSLENIYICIYIYIYIFDLCLGNVISFFFSAN